jgi:mRNA-degrading endonuclease RelE of RelBE toxin-antitoxin system
MNQIEKFLAKLSERERKVVKSILRKINSRDFHNLDLKKLKGEGNIYRVRKGGIRVIFSTDKDIRILSISRRSDTTYNL